MSITTKFGDRGFTMLYYGGKVYKDDIRIEVCGIIDEASAFLGLAKSIVKSKQVKALITAIQKDLIILSTEVVTLAQYRKKIKQKINLENINFIQQHITRLESKKTINGFYISGKDQQSAAFNIARTILRRAERRLVTLNRIQKLPNSCLLVYLNRLSDLLYLLAQ